MLNYNSAVTTLIGVLSTFSIIFLIVAVLIIVATWKIFLKAGEPGWASIVPFYNSYVMFKIAMGNGWLFLVAYIVPFVGGFISGLIPVIGGIISFVCAIIGVVFMVICYFKLAKVFGKGTGFGFGLWLLNPIFMLILAFGSAEYVGVEQ